jgi:hypothetical protein
MSFRSRQEFPPNLAFVGDSMRLQAVPDRGAALSEAQAHEVVEIAVGQALEARNRRRTPQQVTLASGSRLNRPLLLPVFDSAASILTGGPWPDAPANCQPTKR